MKLSGINFLEVVIKDTNEWTLHAIVYEFFKTKLLRKFPRNLIYRFRL